MMDHLIISEASTSAVPHHGAAFDIHGGSAPLCGITVIMQTDDEPQHFQGDVPHHVGPLDCHGGYCFCAAPS